ncbi:MAG: rod shape-determining protein MreD [Phycisphaeraceae bacterium]
MNWLTFLILTYLGYALHLVLAPLWPIGGHEPMVLLILLVFIGLQVPPIAVAWSAIVLGLGVDLLLQQHEPGLIGPWALGFLAAGYALVQLRNLLFRDSMLTIGIMTLVAGVFALLVATTLHTLRNNIGFLGDEPVEGFKAANQLYNGFVTLLNTAVFAVPLGYALLRSRPAWSFSGRGSR